MEQEQSKQKAEKPSIFETMDSTKECDKATNRRTETKNHSSLMKSIYQKSSFR